LGALGVVSSCVAAAAVTACSATVPPLDLAYDEPSESVAGKPNNAGTGGTGPSTGGTGPSTGGTGTGTGGSATGGSGAIGSGGTGVAGRASGGGSGGTTGGTTGAGGMRATGGTGGSSGGMMGATGGSIGVGTGGTSGRGSGAGGRTATAGSGGTLGRGGNPSSAGTSSGGGSAGAAPVGDACATTTVPSGGTQHASNNASGTASGLSWTIWSNGSGGSITTYSTPAFSAAWNNSGDFLARIGLQWNNTKTYDQYGTISAQFSSTKSGSGGGYSYIGIYGWSTNPCVEWYIVDDSYNPMPVNPGNTTNKGTKTIDGGSYTFYTRATSGTGGSKCSGVSNWNQFYSVRQTARHCGTISISQHFDAWAAAGMTLGKMDQAQILVEVGGGTGKIDFPVANVTTTM
jgi:endo-1,4-beta-xylanase